MNSQTRREPKSLGTLRMQVSSGKPAQTRSGGQVWGWFFMNSLLRELWFWFGAIQTKINPTFVWSVMVKMSKMCNSGPSCVIKGNRWNLSSNRVQRRARKVYFGSVSILHRAAVVLPVISEPGGRSWIIQRSQQHFSLCTDLVYIRSVQVGQGAAAAQSCSLF